MKSKILSLLLALNLCLLLFVFRAPVAAIVAFAVLSCIVFPPRRGRSLAVLILFAPFLFAGCTLRQAYPQTHISGYIAGKPFTIDAPKDSTLTGFKAVADTNGTISVEIASLATSLNPTNVAAVASGQAELVTANGNAIVNVLNASAQAAGAAAAIAAKTAVKP